MNESTPRSWLVGTPLSGPALPSGRLAPFWGWILLLNRAEQRELLSYLGLREGEKVLEVGHGPGLMARWMIRRSGAHVAGVDPSPAMVAAARRRARGADIREGNAERTGFPDAEFDTVVAVNNVPMWSDLDLGMNELHRVLRPGGRLVLSWHGGTEPTRSAARLRLPEATLDRIHAQLRGAFGNGERHSLRRVEVFTAVRADTPRLDT